MNRRYVTDEQELNIRRQADEVVKRVLNGAVLFDFASPRLQAIVVGVESLGQTGKKKRDLAEERRQWFETWYRGRNFTVTVPKPDVSNREFARRAKLPIPQTLFYRPATKEVSYEAFMSAVDQASHWTVTDQAVRAKIIWEPAETGYWFWAEIPEDCPRLTTTWNNLNQQIKLLCLEEYAIVWHAFKAQTSRMLDIRFWCWLRTRYKLDDGRLGALDANGYFGEVRVNRDSAERLGIPYDNEGGRAAEVVKNAA